MGDPAKGSIPACTAWNRGGGQPGKVWAPLPQAPPLGLTPPTRSVPWIFTPTPCPGHRGQLYPLTVGWVGNAPGNGDPHFCSRVHRGGGGNLTLQGTPIPSCSFSPTLAKPPLVGRPAGRVLRRRCCLTPAVRALTPRGVDPSPSPAGTDGSSRLARDSAEFLDLSARQLQASVNGICVNRIWPTCAYIGCLASNR